MSDPPDSPSAAKSTKKQEFDVLFDLYKLIYDRFFDFALKNGMFTSIVLGWIFSSETTRTFITEKGLPIKIAASAGMLLYSSFHAYWCFKYRSRSEDCHEFIRKLNFMPIEYMAPYQVGKAHWVSVALFHGILSVYVVVLLIAFT
jgi:hypothetical protein